MVVKLHNTLSGKTEEFKPINLGRVGMYHCGPTVYDYIHIGNLRAFFTADILRRMFEFNKYEVTQVMNITDVGIGGDNDEGEDKMVKGLKREGKAITLETMRELGDFYTEKFLENLGALNIEMPHHLPKASDHIKEDIDVIKTLEEKGFVYKTSDGLYFDTLKDPDYGKLGKITKESTEELQTRIGTNSEKKNPRDFAIWKFNSKLGYPSPWGQGFPGWHMECSAMSRKYLGEHFDIHTGGVDLAPIHHNNEIAQSESACDCTFVNYWLHNAFVNVSSGKMAKSEGTGITLQTVIEHNIAPLAYRYWLLGGHYRTPMTFTWEALEGAQNAFKRLQNSYLELGKDIGIADSRYLANFSNFVSDDLDTPKALALLWDLFKDSSVSNADKKATILEFDKVLGLGLAMFTKQEIPEDVFELAQEREQARQNKDWAKSDELRDKIAKLGYEIKDTVDGPILRKF